MGKRYAKEGKIGKAVRIALVCAGAAVATLTAPSPASAGGAGVRVPLLKELYSLDYPVTTSSDKARAYFNQGLALTYGFDHSDAEASFLEAIRLDPDFAMAYWGIAFILGPNINAPMDAASVPRAWEMSRKALSLADSVSERERALIEALAKRYEAEPPKERSVLDKAFADAMRQVYGAYGVDPNVAVLFAEALMDLHPWDYWTAEGAPRPWTPEIEAVLKKVVADHPLHPHAHHLYIHLMENSPTPEVAIKSADVIGRIVPLSGHLVHMAAHAYYATGLYHDCSRTNEEAIGVDRLLAASFDSSGLYQLAYVPHVLHFLIASYMMEGRSEEALATARRLAAGTDRKKMREPGYGTLQHFYVTPYYTLVRFGRWDEILTESEPAEDLVYPRAMLHYARGMALIRKGDQDGSARELESLRTLSKDPSLESVTIWDLNNVADLLRIAVQVLAGEVAAAAGSFDEAIDHLEKGVALEEGLTYDEPPPWYFPVRQALGAVLLAAGKTGEAETVFRRDLRKNAENPWSLLGLSRALAALGKSDRLQDAEKRFRRAWARSDVELTGPIF